MKKIKKNDTFTFIWHVVITVMPFLLCSCYSPRAELAEKWRLSAEALPQIEGKWRNESKVRGGYYTLWRSLTGEETAPLYAVVQLKKTDQKTLTATLLVIGEETDSRTISFKQRKSWIELPTQHFARPCLWYIIWGWIRKDPALSIDTDGNGDLWVNMVGDFLFVVGVVPTIFGDGGGYGVVDLYERVE